MSTRTGASKALITASILTILILGSGCQHQPQRGALNLPPSNLLKTYGVPEYRGKTWGDLVVYARQQSGVIEKHNIDKRALQRWYDSQRGKK